MAGIGFELKKLFKGKGFLSSIKAYLYSALVSVGPFVLCVIMIVSIQLLLNFMDVPLKEKELFIATVVYTFIFAQIITSGFTMIITRFISDMLYGKKLGYILPSLYGIISIVIPIAAIPAIIFLWKSPLPVEIKLTSYLFFMELIIVYLIMVYLTALKDYMRIVKSFIWGVFITLALAFIFIKYTNLSKVFAMLLSMNIGFLIIISLLITYLKKFFQASEEKSSNKYYSFLAYFDKYLSLYFISFLYTLALYSHNFIFWSSNFGVKIASTYVFAPTYDVPTFYAFLSIIPSMVVFVVSVETSFYEKYHNYYSLITGKGSFAEIEDAQKSMSRVLWAEIRNLMEIQIFFSIIFIVGAFYLFPRMGLTRLSFDIFMLLILGAYCDIILLIIILILLYFEDRKGALMISIIFFITSVLFTEGTLILGETTYGLGLFLSTFITLIAAFIRLRIYLNNIHYHTFLGQPVIYKEIKGIFSKLVDIIYRSR